MTTTVTPITLLPLVFYLAPPHKKEQQALCLGTFLVPLLSRETLNSTSAKHRPKMLPTPSAKAFLQTQTRFLSIVGPTGVEKTTEKVEKSLPKTPVQRSNSVRPRGYDGGLTPKLDPRGSKAILRKSRSRCGGSTIPSPGGHSQGLCTVRTQRISWSSTRASSCRGPENITALPQGSPSDVPRMSKRPFSERSWRFLDTPASLFGNLWPINEFLEGTFWAFFCRRRFCQNHAPAVVGAQFSRGGPSEKQSEARLRAAQAPNIHEKRCQRHLRKHSCTLGFAFC